MVELMFFVVVTTKYVRHARTDAHGSSRIHLEDCIPIPISSVLCKHHVTSKHEKLDLRVHASYATCLCKDANAYAFCWLSGCTSAVACSAGWR